MVITIGLISMKRLLACSKGWRGRRKTLPTLESDAVFYRSWRLKSAVVVQLRPVRQAGSR